MIIIDTDILIDFGRGIPDAVRCLEQIEQNSVPSVSIVTQMELIVGCGNKNELRTSEAFLERFHIVPLDEEISDKAVSLLCRYRLSHGLLIADAMIAATAIVSDTRFISKNQRDYRFIEELRLLPYPAPSA